MARLSLKTKIFILIEVLIIAGCDSKSRPVSDNEITYSHTQKYLFQLIDDYKAAFHQAKQSGDTGKIQNEYLERMRYFLVDSLARHIDSITVTVDSVIKSGWLVSTQFHTGDIEFRYGMTFKDSMPQSVDSLYQFMINLVPGSVVTVNFNHLGSGELNSPDDRSKKIMRIFAFPEPLDSK